MQARTEGGLHLPGSTPLSPETTRPCPPGPALQVFVPGSVFIQLVVAGVAALVGLLATFWQADLDWTVWGSALMLLGSRASQVYFQVGAGAGGTGRGRLASSESGRAPSGIQAAPGSTWG